MILPVTLKRDIEMSINLSLEQMNSVLKIGIRPFGAEYRSFSEDVFLLLHLSGRGISAIALKHSCSHKQDSLGVFKAASG